MATLAPLPTSFDSSVSNKINGDTILYFTHVSFAGDILTSGLGFVLLLMIITSILVAQLRNLGKYCVLSMHLLANFFFHHLSVTIFFLTAIFGTTFTQFVR